MSKERNRLWIPEWSPDVQTTVPSTIEIKMPTMHMQIGGYFYVDLIDAKTGRVKQHLEFPNLLVDSGMDAIGAQDSNQGGLFQYIAVGTDSTPPVVGDTTMGAELDRTISKGGFGSEEITGLVTGTAHVFDAPYHFQRYVRLFTESEANGNLTELGWFNTDPAGTMVVHSLFKDSGGSPITLVKTSADQLKITYEWRVYPPVGNNPSGAAGSGTFSPISSGTVILASTTHSWTSSGLNILGQSWGAGVGLVQRTFAAPQLQGRRSASGLISPSGSDTEFDTAADVNATSTVLAAYVAGTFQRDMLATWDPGASRNFTGFSVRITSFADAQFQIIVSESIQFTSLDQLKLNFRFKFDRAVL